MARARNIKPGFFTNEQLADNCPLGRLLFIGMWTLADYKGDFEWKSRTIKIQILPWDECDIDALAINLDKSGLIRFYSNGNKIYVNIPNFDKHQNPHKNEKAKGSDIPAYSESYRQAIDLKGLTINRDLSGLKPECSQSDPADSLLLIPESPFPNPEESANADCSEPFSSKPPTDDSPIFISIPTNRFNTQGEVKLITEKQILDWEGAYPAVNVRRVLAQIRSWVINNPGKRKTAGGMNRFVDSWLAREQNRGGSNVAANQQPIGTGAGKFKPSPADIQRAHAKQALDRLDGKIGDSPVHSTD